MQPELAWCNTQCTEIDSTALDGVRKVAAHEGDSVGAMTRRSPVDESPPHNNHHSDQISVPARTRHMHIDERSSSVAGYAFLTCRS